jgi:hypothetical protein
MVALNVIQVEDEPPSVFKHVVPATAGADFILYTIDWEVWQSKPIMKRSSFIPRP